MLLSCLTPIPDINVAMAKDRDFGLDEGDVDPFPMKYRLSSTISDVALFRLFKPVKS